MGLHTSDPLQQNGDSKLLKKISQKDSKTSTVQMGLVSPMGHKKS
jgi:hypothetical protein